MDLLRILRDRAQSLQPELVELRHTIHRHPELHLDLPLTQRAVLESLSGLPLAVTTGRGLSSVAAVLEGSRPGPTVLLRADMDALPLDEDSGEPFSSEEPGRMHACGHDLHTSILVGAAKLLVETQAELQGNVLFMFQPGEETTGGAAPMIEEGLFSVPPSPPIAAYGLHVTSSMLPTGYFAIRRGTLLASADILRVTVRGKGGHASNPHQAKDPIPAACEIVTALQTHVTRSYDVHDPVIATVGTFHAGTAYNVIPETATLEATVRTFSEATHERIAQTVPALIKAIASAHDLSTDVDYELNYPVTINNAEETDFLAETAAAVFGPNRLLWLDHPVGGSEDFSYILNEIPGSFVFLGACSPERDSFTAAYNHSPQAVFDDNAIAPGVALMAALAHERLKVAQPVPV